MQNFDFHNPTQLIFGRSTIERIGREVAARGQTNVLLLAGGGSIKRNGTYEQVVASLQAADVSWTEVWGVQPNPTLTKVREAIDAARENNAQAILAVGGGSVVDSAKAVAAGLYMDDVWQAFENRDAVEKAAPVYTVLTLSATGTEMNPFAVVTNEAEKKKWNIFGPALYPVVSIVDPSRQATLPWSQTVNGALDGISHVMEFYFVDADADATLSVDEGLMRSLIRAADTLKDDPEDYPARASLAWATTLALNGVSGAGLAGGDWSSHGIEHGISALHPEVAHGAGLGVVFPAWALYCADANRPLFDRWAREVWGADGVAAGVQAMREKIRSWDHPTTLGELGVDADSIDEIAANAAAFGLGGQVKKLTEDDVREILKLAL